MTRTPTEDEPAEVPTSGVSRIGRLARQGDLEALGEAMDVPIPADHASVCGWNALSEAAWAGHTEAARVLVNAGLDVNTPTNDGLTPLMIAASRGHLGMVRYLCAQGASVDRRSPDGRTAMESALQAARVEVATLLHHQGVQFDGPLATLFVRAICSRQGTGCALIEPSGQGNRSSSVWRWALSRPIELTPELIEPLSACLEDGQSLDTTSDRTQLDHVRLQIPVEFSVDAEHPALRNAPDLPSGGWRYRCGWTEHVQRILHGEITPDTPDAFGYIPLLEAIRNDSPEAVRALLTLGADPNIVPHYGCMRGATMLINAAERGDEAVVEALVAAGAAIDSETLTGWTALMVAAARGREGSVRALVRAGANLEARNAQGQTALSLAQQKRHARVARLLIVANNNVRLLRRD